MASVLWRFLDAWGLDEEPLCIVSLLVTNDMHVAKTPSFGPGCSSFVTWPMKYLMQG